jgi:hypothetical protein
MKMRHPVVLIVLVCATLLSSHPARAQFSQQGPKLVGTGAVGNAFQGNSVSLSADGNTAIVGGPADNSNAGAAWVWTRNAGVWTQQGPKLVGSGAVGNAYQGAVSLSADGNTAIVGGNADNGHAGAAWVWTRNAGVWTQQGPKLVGSGALGLAQQGFSVSLSADGNLAIIGGPADDGHAGAAWVWTRSAGVWTEQGALFGGFALGPDVEQGYSVSLSNDGNRAIVGGPANYGDSGAAWFWTKVAGVFTQESVLGGFGAVEPAQVGFSVSLSNDGKTAIAGGNIDNGDAGAAWIWTRSGGVWTQQGTKLVGSGAVDPAQQGFSVSLSADGNTAIIGGNADNSQAGAAWVFAAAGQARPIITSFKATPSTITPGQSSTLSWTTTNATSVSISGVAGTQPVNGSVPVFPTASTTYTLTAIGSGGTATAITTVTRHVVKRRAVAPQSITLAPDHGPSGRRF